MHVHECVLFISIYKPARFLMLFPSVGRALPSHYAGSRTNHRLCVSVSPNLSLFSLLSLVIFLFHSLRQLPSPLGPQSTLITFSSRMYSISLALLSIFLLFFLALLSVTLLCAPSCCLLSSSQVSTLLITHCLTLYVSFFVSFSSVKDLDTEKYVHLVSFSL